MKPSFGVDFGTTNTRVAYFDGKHVRMIPFDRDGQTEYHFPTAVAYDFGSPVAFGWEALTPERQSASLASLKWLLTEENPIEIDGGNRIPVEIVADFLRHLKERVETASREKFVATAVTIPVHYPTSARATLEAAFQSVGVKITQFFFEPVAAIYAGLLREPVEGVSVVFDWGGGSLDIATVEIRQGLMRTRQVVGWNRGGTHFDQMIAEQAIIGFLGQHLSELTPSQVLENPHLSHALRLRVESAKIALANSTGGVTVDLDRFLGLGLLRYPLTNASLESLIEHDLVGAFARLDVALKETRVTHQTIARLFLSGGTCLLRAIAERLTRDVAGNRLVSHLRLPDGAAGRQDGGLRDIGNATAIGAALLEGFEVRPIFANAIGVRLSGGNGVDQFCPIFRRGDPAGSSCQEVPFYITDASAGAARLLICEQSDPDVEPLGRLLRVVNVPINRSERWLDTRFEIGSRLTLEVQARGREDLRRDPFHRANYSGICHESIQSINFGFPMPVRSSTGPSPIGSSRSVR